ncbi:MAG: hypothetical protein ACJAZT_000698 [Gammaproteobacteria bacterium]|jgi:hypothetical protein
MAEVSFVQEHTNAPFILNIKKAVKNGSLSGVMNKI